MGYRSAPAITGSYQRLRQFAKPRVGLPRTHGKDGEGGEGGGAVLVASPDCQDVAVGVITLAMDGLCGAVGLELDEGLNSLFRQARSSAGIRF